MKPIKKILSILGVAIAMSFVVLPLAGWTCAANADEAEAPMQTAAIGGIQPLFGGSTSKTLEFENKEWVTITASAGNWIAPWADEAVITIESGSNDAYCGFEVQFIWKNERVTRWRHPRQLDPSTGEPLQLLERTEEGRYLFREAKNCDASGLMGTPGDRWACDNIKVLLFARIGNGPMKTLEVGPVYF